MMKKDKEHPVTAGDSMVWAVREQRAIICPKGETYRDGALDVAVKAADYSCMPLPY